MQASLVVSNVVWLRLGLFGGGFGIKMIDEAQETLELGPISVELMYAGLRFQYDATYKVP